MQTVLFGLNRTLSGTTTPSQSGPGSESSEGVLYITRSSSITEASLSDCLKSYLGHLLVGSYPFGEMHSVYYIAPIKWALVLTRV